jgi:hypothetical protein
VPVIVTLKLVAPWSPELGLVEVTVGAALTVNTPVPVPTPPSGLVTVTLRAPVVAPAAIAMFAVSCVALTNVVELTVIPVPENDAASPVPLTKLVPVIVTLKLVAPLSPELGLVEVTVGPALTVNTFVPVPTPPSGLVTVTLRVPVVAPDAIVMFAVSDVALTNVVELTVIPVPENDADAPLTKPVPVIVTLWLVAP